jgi:hypothetical protein
MKNVARNLVMIAALSVASLPAGAQAQPTLCVNPAISLPGVSGPPKWDVNASPTCVGTNACSTVDDPRWAAGPLFSTYPVTPVTQTAFRVVRNGDVVYVSVRCDIGGACGTNDTVYLAWKRGDTDPGSILKLGVDIDAPSAGPPDSLNAPTWFKPVSAGNTCLCTGPSGCSPPTSAIDCNQLATLPWDAGAGGLPKPTVWKTTNGWRMHVALGGMGTVTRFAVGVKVLLDDGTAAVWPPCEGNCLEDNVPKDPAAWAVVPATCSNAVTISYLQVGAFIQNSPPAANACTAGNYGNNLDKTHANQLVACPDPAQSVNAINAVFNLSDWGSVAGPTSWMQIGSARNTSPGERLITTPYTRVGPPPPVNHQCMLVQLSNAGAANLNFAPAAVYRNMWFVPASRVEEEGRVNLLAEDVRPHVVGPESGLYLYVQTQNMPGPGSPVTTLPLVQMDALRRDTETGALPKIPDSALVEKDPMRQIQARPDVYRLTSLEHSLEQLWPTFKVHPFLYTGRKTIVAGVARDLVVPLTPFGLYVRHEGPFTGFQTVVKLEGQQLEPGKLAVSAHYPAGENRTFQLPVLIETQDVDGGVGPGNPVPDGGAGATVPPVMDGSIPPMGGNGCPPSQKVCQSAIGRPGGGSSAIGLLALVALALSVFRSARRRPDR